MDWENLISTTFTIEDKHTVITQAVWNQKWK